MVNGRAVVVFSMVAVALITTYASSGGDDRTTLKTGGLYGVKNADAPICEVHDELVAAAYEYDGGGTPDCPAALRSAKEARSRFWFRGPSMI